MSKSNARQLESAGLNGQSSLENFETGTESEDWLPRHDGCDCGGNDEFCFRCVNWTQLDERVANVGTLAEELQ